MKATDSIYDQEIQTRSTLTPTPVLDKKFQPDLLRIGWLFLQPIVWTLYFLDLKGDEATIIQMVQTI